MSSFCDTDHAAEDTRATIPFVSSETSLTNNGKFKYRKPLTIQEFEPFSRNSGLFTLSQTSPCFYVSAIQVLKTLWEKEKLLSTSNFSFSQSVLYPFGEVSAIFSKSEIVICKHFE